MTTTVKATYDGKTFVPLGPVELPVGGVFDLEVRPEAELPLGSPALLLQTIERGFLSSPDAVDEWEEAIRSATRPASYEGVFDDLA